MKNHQIHGVGAALVDIEVVVSDGFLEQNQIERGVKTPVDEPQSGVRRHFPLPMVRLSRLFSMGSQRTLSPVCVPRLLIPMRWARVRRRLYVCADCAA
jgi:hypothetical protein